jgi:NADH:quinone reductase (non-electrogenic)
MTHHKILILGGGYAGLMAAARVSRSGAAVTLIDARPTFFQRIRFHELLAGGSPKTLEYASALARRGVRFVQARAESLEPERRRVVARSADGSRVEIGYDTLIFALGSTTAPSVPGVAEHAVRLDNPAAIREAGARIRALSAQGGRVLIVGGGLTGVETAAELAERYPDLHVKLATRGWVGEGYSEAGSSHLRRRLTDVGVSLLDGPGIAGLEAGRALREDGSAIDFDLCVWAGGFEAPVLAREAGLAVDRSGRILVDSTLQAAGHPDIFAAGDAVVATFEDGKAIRMGCVSAMPLGIHAGENVRRILNGQEPRPFDFGFQLRCISLGRKDGLVQFVDTEDTPRPKVWTRRPAAVLKEFICRMTYTVVRNELRFGVPLYRWPGSGREAMVQSPARRAEARSQG